MKNTETRLVGDDFGPSLEFVYLAYLALSES